MAKNRRSRAEGNASGTGREPDLLVKSSVDRRGFVRATGGLLVGAMFSSACEEGTLTGTVSFQITGLPPGTTDAGRATITGFAIADPINVDLKSATSGSVEVPVGTYSVTYQPPTGFGMSPGETNVADVIVGADEVTQLSFAVESAVGSIRVTVQGVAVGSTDCGSALIRRIDIAGQPQIELIIPIAGTATMNVASGTYRVTMAAPDGHRVAAGQVNPRDVVVETAGQGSVTFIVESTPAPTGVLFHSDWSTALGVTAAAFRDAGKARPWTFHCCTANVNSSIVTAASLGLEKWPTTNVYRVGTQAIFPSQIATHQIEVDLGAPSPDSHRYFRLYLQVTHGDAHGNGTEGSVEHGFETAESGGGDGLNLMRIPRNNGTWFPAYREIATGIRYVAPGLNLLKNSTYRIEMHLAYGTSTYTIEVRIFDEDGVQVASEADFYQYVPVNNTGLRLGAATFNYVPAHHRFLRVGTNGPSSNFPMNNLVDQDLYLHGAVAVSDSGWLGPYNNGI